MEIVKKLVPAVTLICLLAWTLADARHGSNIFFGGMMGAGIGAMAGGRHGVVPGLMTGLAAGTVAEIIEDADQPHHYCHHHDVVYTHEVRPSREWLEEEIERLEGKLHKAHQNIRQLEHDLEMLEHELNGKNAEIHHLKKQLKGNDKAEIVISAKAITG
jgi:hypothetical protein